MTPLGKLKPMGILRPLAQLGKRLLGGNQLEGLRLAATAWILARLVLLIWGALLWRTHMIPPESVSQPSDEARGSWGETRTLLVDIWKRWDALHYEAIAEGGYRERHLSVFFPLYPLLARGVGSLLSLSPISALLLVSHVGSFLALLVLYQLACREMGTAIARRSVAAAVLFPTAFFLFAPFTESLSLLLTLLTVWLVRERRWFPASLTGLAMSEPPDRLASDGAHRLGSNPGLDEQTMDGAPDPTPGGSHSDSRYSGLPCPAHLGGLAVHRERAGRELGADNALAMADALGHPTLDFIGIVRIG